MKTYLSKLPFLHNAYTCDQFQQFQQHNRKTSQFFMRQKLLLNFRYLQNSSEGITAVLTCWKASQRRQSPPHFGAESSSQWVFLCRLHQQHFWDFDCKSPQQRSCMFHRCVTEPRIFQSGSEIVQHFGHLFCTPLTRFDLWDSTAPFKILIIYNHEYEMRTMLYSIPHLWMQRGLEPFSWNPENVAYFFSDQLLWRCRIQRSSKRIQMSLWPMVWGHDLDQTRLRHFSTQLRQSADITPTALVDTNPTVRAVQFSTQFRQPLSTQFRP